MSEIAIVATFIIPNRLQKATPPGSLHVAVTNNIYFTTYPASTTRPLIITAHLLHLPTTIVMRHKPDQTGYKVTH